MFIKEEAPWKEEGPNRRGMLTRGGWFEPRHFAVMEAIPRKYHHNKGGQMGWFL
jgi:hypothetical protein